VRLVPRDQHPLISLLTPSRYVWGLKVGPRRADGLGPSFYDGDYRATALATPTAPSDFSMPLEEPTTPTTIAAMPMAERGVSFSRLYSSIPLLARAAISFKSIVDLKEHCQSRHWRREVVVASCSYLVDPYDAVACAEDRATMWATGSWTGRSPPVR